MPTYLVERYLPGSTGERLTTTALQSKQAAEQMSATGTPVRYLHSTFLLQDEMCFCLFEAASASAVAEANGAAGIPYERISEAIHLTAEGLSRVATTGGAGSAGGDCGKGGLPCR